MNDKKDFFLTAEHFNKGLTPYKYSRFLKTQQEGRWCMFDPLFFFTQFFWFIYYKMYAESLVYILWLSLLSAVLFIDDSSVGVTFYIMSMLSSGVILSFCNLRLYQQALNRKLYINRSSPNLQIFKITPYSPIRYIFITVFFSWMLALCYFFINPVFIYSYNQVVTKLTEKTLHHK